ncbi:hypothetical protein DFH07DRAFT_928211 [Mycena maculata]|uniref:Uncharacterized protein n=1 Tax=Mycena maculata TaxID=230809 RepID=A0AAD7MVR2_9AGAR|nr:hypothetical protein DFH07DRAFT_928211 [Mycena maculata]
MARILTVLFALLVASVAVAAPVEKRQIGDLTCNIDRLKIVSTLAGTTSAVGKIQGTDPTTATQVAAAQAGLSSASDGIKTIAAALFTGQTAPASARTQVQTGLLAAQSALGNITDPTATAAAATAQSSLAAAIQDGQGVVANCN